MAYTVKSVDRSRQWASQKGGPMVSYYLTLVDSQGQETSNVELAQKTTTPEPQPGQTLDGNIDQGPYGPKFQKAFNQGGGGRSNSGTSPAEQTSIRASVAMDKALVAVEQAATLGLVKIEPDREGGDVIASHAALVARYFKYFFRLMDAAAKDAA